MGMANTRSSWGGWAASLLVLLSLVPAATNGDTWQRLGPEGGRFVGIAVDSADADRLIAVEGGTGAVVKSDDGGNSWRTLGSVDGSRSMTDFRGVGLSRLYAVSGTYFHHSSDQGQTWVRHVLPSSLGSAYLVRPSPLHEGTIHVFGMRYASPQYHAASASSTDGGETWTVSAVASLDYLYDPYDAAVTSGSPDTLYLVGFGRVAGAYRGALHVSTDGGNTWTDRSSAVSAVETASGYPFYSVAVAPTDAATVYISGRYLYCSNDGGVSWHGGCYFGYCDALWVNPTAADVVVGATSSGSIYRTTNGGSSCTSAPGTFSGMPAGLHSSAASPLTIYSATAHGLYRSVDAGADWGPCQAGLNLSTVTAMAITPAEPGSIYAVVGQTNLYVSDNKGDDWEGKTDQFASLCGSFDSLWVHAETPTVMLGLEGYG